MAGGDLGMMMAGACANAISCGIAAMGTNASMLARAQGTNRSNMKPAAPTFDALF
jgi:hypothetical protein